MFVHNLSFTRRSHCQNRFPAFGDYLLLGCVLIINEYAGQPALLAVWAVAPVLVSTPTSDPMNSFGKSYPPVPLLPSRSHAGGSALWAWSCVGWGSVLGVGLSVRCGFQALL